MLTAQSGNSLTIIHRYGPCSPYNESKPSQLETLARDSLRVASLQERISGSTGDNTTFIEQSGVSIPARSGAYLGTSNYVVTIGLGTPTRAQTVEIDTGSDICWVQCRPCTSCYQQQEPIFNPSASSSYSRFSCSSTACTNLNRNRRSCSAGACVYGVQYGDGSTTVGFLSSDKLTLTAADVFQSFIFGCGVNNRGLLEGVAGLVGLGRGSYSLVSQTASRLGNVFSYCFPDRESSTGRLTFGRSSTSGVFYTPMLTNPRAPSFYFIDLIGISVGGTRLPVTAAVFRVAGTIIDSGTVITRLPPAAYAALRSAFRSAMLRYTRIQASSILDTCYDFSNAGTVTYPPIKLHYTGVDVTLGTAGVFFYLGSSRYCLAFAGNTDATQIGIIGNVQQKTLEVIYDIGARRIGFAAGTCT